MSLLQADGSGAAADGRAAPDFISEAAAGRGSSESEQDWSLAPRLHISRAFLAGLTPRAQRTAVKADSASYAAQEEDDYGRAVARELDLPFVSSIDPDRLILRDRDLQAALVHPGGVHMALTENGGGPPVILVAANSSTVTKLKGSLAAKPDLAQRLRIVSRHTLREAFVARAEPELLRKARDGLFDRFPDLSARIVVNAWQGSMIGAGIVVLPTALMLAPAGTMLVLHAFFSLLFFSCVFLRLAASQRAGRIRFAPLKRVSGAELPVYTVLVALYREADIVPDLLVALGRLVWPRGKLEIKLVCEADDEATLHSLQTQKLRPSIEIIRVPVGGPRTKPKALAYALQFATGEFVALYDAEDRPHPLQLVEAWQRFDVSDPHLACVQAPLVISNWDSGIMERMFAFEYAALFRGLLPWLSRRGLMFPLGGTSNHFRGLM